MCGDRPLRVSWTSWNTGFSRYVLFFYKENLNDQNQKTDWYLEILVRGIILTYKLDYSEALDPFVFSACFVSSFSCVGFHGQKCPNLTEQFRIATSSSFMFSYQHFCKVVSISVELLIRTKSFLMQQWMLVYSVLLYSLIHRIRERF